MRIIKITKEVKIKLLKSLQDGFINLESFPELQIEPVDLSQMSNEDLILRAQNIHKITTKE